MQGCTPFGFLCQARVSTLRKQCSSILATRTGDGQRGYWINAERKRAALSSKTIVQSPVACAIRPENDLLALGGRP
jgi:hypothetical protein